jgi:hypothetical protein
VRPDIHPRCRAGRSPQSRARDRGSLGTRDEAPCERWTSIEREEEFNRKNADRRNRDAPLGREDHDSSIDSLTRAGGPGWDRPRRAADDALPEWDAGP